MDAGERALEHFTGTATGDSDLAGRSLHPAHVNHMAADEPPACSEPGLPGLMATSAWLRLAFTDLRFEIIDTAARYIEEHGRPEPSRLLPRLERRPGNEVVHSRAVGVLRSGTPGERVQ